MTASRIPRTFIRTATSPFRPTNPFSHTSLSRFDTVTRTPRTRPNPGHGDKAALIHTQTSQHIQSPSQSSSTSNPGPSDDHPRTKTALILATSIASGLAGYFLHDHFSFLRTPGGNGLVEDWEPKFGSPDEFLRGIQELRNTFKEGAVSTGVDELVAHGMTDQAHHDVVLHSVIVYPESTEDVVKIVKIATKYRMPLIPYSGATSLEGQVNGHPTGGICVDMSNMDRILQIHEADSDLVCQPGVRWVDINETLREKGIPLFFPIDPAPGATIGGMLSTGCSGTNAVRYGTAKSEWFLNATVVLPSGEVIKTRRRSRKSSAGFDTTKLFIGAEGTLGIVTEVTIRLAPVLPTTVAVAQFPNVKKATEAVIEVMNQGVGIQCVELVDSVFISAVNNYRSSGPPSSSQRIWPVRDSLFFKFQGPTSASMKETAAITEKIVKKHGATLFELARNPKEADELWSDRKNAHWAGLSLVEGARGWPTDVCVPVSALPQLVYETKNDLAKLNLVSTIVGHVGDGNFHALILFKTDEELKLVKEAVHRMVERAIALDGTCTGEHGVGIGKKEYLVEELGLGTVELMKTIKRAIDPLGLFNPGKLYPDTSQATRKHGEKV